MRNVFIALIMGVGLAGCVGGASEEEACEVFSPAEIDLPTTQEDQRVDELNNDNPAPHAEQRC